MNDPSQEITLYFKFDEMRIHCCNFNLKGQLILFCTVQTSIRYDRINIVCVYSIQSQKFQTKCQKIYKIPKEAEVICISKYDKIWLRLNNKIYEWNLLTGHTTIISKDIYKVIKSFRKKYFFLDREIY